MGSPYRQYLSQEYLMSTRSVRHRLKVDLTWRPSACKSSARDQLCIAAISGREKIALQRFHALAMHLQVRQRPLCRLRLSLHGTLNFPLQSSVKLDRNDKARQAHPSCRLNTSVALEPSPTPLSPRALHTSRQQALWHAPPAPIRPSQGPGKGLAVRINQGDIHCLLSLWSTSSPP